MVRLALVVAEMDLDALVEERQLTQTRTEDLPLERAAGENRMVGEERDLSTGLLTAFADDLKRLRDVPAGELDVMYLAAALHLDLHPVGKGVHAAHANAVETAGNLVVGAIELAAGMKNRKNNLNCGLALCGVHVDRNAAPVILNRERAIGIDENVDVGAVSRKSLINGVVDHLVNQMVVATLARVADIHCRTLADSLHALQNLNVGGIVVGRLCGVLNSVFCGLRGIFFRHFISPKN